MIAWDALAGAIYKLSKVLAVTAQAHDSSNGQFASLARRGALRTNDGGIDFVISRQTRALSVDWTTYSIIASWALITNVALDKT